MTDRKPLTLLPHDLRQRYNLQVNYRDAYTAAVDGRIPAVRAETGRWSFAMTDLPVIAKTLASRAAPAIAA